MNDIGSQLRAAREVKGLTLEQAFKTTRIKVAYLEAIEANQIDVLPGLVQARGFVRSYANFLGLDGEQLASALDAEKASAPEVRPLTVMPAPSKLTPPPVTPGKPAAQPAPKPSISIPVKPSPSDRPPDRSMPPLQMPKISLKPSKPVSSPVPSGSGSGIPTSVLIIGAAVLFILGALLIIAALTAGGQSPSPQAPPNVPASFDPAVPAARTLAGPLSSGPVSITLKAGEHVWVRITADGQTVFAGMLEPNT